MRECGIFNALVVDESRTNVKYGPSPRGKWIEIGGWGELEWAVLVAIVSHPRGASEHDTVRRANGGMVAQRKIVYRIRERIRTQQGIPPRYTDDVIVTKKGSATWILNPQIKVRVLPGRLRGTSEFGEARALDSVLHAITRAGMEVFGESGFDRAIDLLPDDARIETIEMKYPPGRWIPVRHVSSWARAIREGPAGFSFDAFHQFLRKMESYRLSPFFVDYSQCGSKHRLSNVGEMWRTCYDSGDVEALVSPNDDWFEIRLWNHPYCNNEMSRRTHGLCWLALAETLGAKESALEACELEPLTGALRIRVSGTFAE